MQTFTRYKLKISFFISFIIFLMIFITGSLFFISQNYKIDKYKQYKLNHIEKHIKSLSKSKIEKIVDKLNELSIDYIVGDIVSGEKNKTNKYILDNFLSKWVYVEGDDSIIFNNFDIKKCNINFDCIKVKKDNYIFIVGIKKENKIAIKTTLINFAILSFLISLLFFPGIYLIVRKLTKPIEINFEFMKNFVNNAGHELKTPIANINLSAQILEQKKEFNQEIVKDIVDESTNMSKLIDTLLQMSILSKFEKKETINLKDLTEKIINEYKKELEDFNLNINLENTFKKVNKNHIEILLRNLIKNAIKYNNDKKIINISLNKKNLIIENSGLEIKNGNKKKIFDLFYRIEKNKDGYGLGLSIVKKIVDINKWKIRVISKNGINSFIVEF